MLGWGFKCAKEERERRKGEMEKERKGKGKREREREGRGGDKERNALVSVRTEKKASMLSFESRVGPPRISH